MWEILWWALTEACLSGVMVEEDPGQEYSSVRTQGRGPEEKIS